MQALQLLIRGHIVSCRLVDNNQLFKLGQGISLLQVIADGIQQDLLPTIGGDYNADSGLSVDGSFLLSPRRTVPVCSHNPLGEHALGPRYPCFAGARCRRPVG